MKKFSYKIFDRNLYIQKLWGSIFLSMKEQLINHGYSTLEVPPGTEETALKMVKANFVMTGMEVGSVKRFVFAVFEQDIESNLMEPILLNEQKIRKLLA